MAVALHKNARCPAYPTTDGSLVDRFPVSDNFVSWTTAFPNYCPVKYTAPRHHDQCDVDINSSDCNFNFNQKDGLINRVSNVGTFQVDAAGYPLNPMGRTGVIGRGRLPRWGPNHAADCLVTRWKRSNSGEVVINASTKKPILQFVAICRRDLQVWAIPGGKVNPGEDVDATFIREFHEEALDGFDPAKNSELWQLLNEFFSSGVVVFCGYVDDPRNTDNAWMETTVKNFHDGTGKTIEKFPLKAGDDAGDLRWQDIGSELKLYASHVEFVKNVAVLHNAHW